MILGLRNVYPDHGVGDSVEAGAESITCRRPAESGLLGGAPLA